MTDVLRKSHLRKAADQVGLPEVELPDYSQNLSDPKT